MTNTEIQEILAEIGEKKRRSNELAAEFRRLYRESQEAYSDGDGELAKELSEEGHEIQNECESLNQEVRDLYERLKDLNEQNKSSARTNVLSVMALVGIPPNFQQAIRDTLKSLPTQHVSAKLIERISYSDQYVKGESGFPIQAQSHFNLVTGKATIVINRQSPSGFTVLSDINTAVIHEVGHVVYRKILNENQRNRWMTEFTHRHGYEESFAVSYWYYHSKCNELAKEFPTVKAFFDQFDL